MVTLSLGTVPALESVTIDVTILSEDTIQQLTIQVLTRIGSGVTKSHWRIRSSPFICTARLGQAGASLRRTPELQNLAIRQLHQRHTKQVQAHTIARHDLPALALFLDTVLQ